MSPTAELRFLRSFESGLVLQQKWVQHHIPAGKTEAPFEWRDVHIVKEQK